MTFRTFDSHGRIHCSARAFHWYPADALQPWISVSPPTTGGTVGVSSQAHFTTSVAPLELATHAFENVSLTGLHGAAKH